MRQQYNPNLQATANRNIDGVLIDPTIIMTASGTNVRVTGLAVAALDMTPPMDNAKATDAAAAIATSAAALSANGADLSALDALIESYGEYRGESQT